MSAPRQLKDVDSSDEGKITWHNILRMVLSCNYAGTMSKVFDEWCVTYTRNLSITGLPTLIHDTLLSRA
jgi:hypothetical protein